MAENREIKTITKRKGISHHQLKRVCAYIRVSTGHDLQLNSLENQEQYFKRLITSHPDYEFCGIYSDAGVSGVKNDRPAFNAMMEAVRNQEIDLIITKNHITVCQKYDVSAGNNPGIKTVKRWCDF